MNVETIQMDPRIARLLQRLSELTFSEKDDRPGMLGIEQFRIGLQVVLDKGSDTPDTELLGIVSKLVDRHRSPCSNCGGTETYTVCEKCGPNVYNQSR